MKKTVIVIVIFLILASLFTYGTTKNEIIDYFNQLVFSSEFGGANVRCKKWAGDIKIFVLGNCPDYLKQELGRIIFELNGLIKSLKLVLVNSRMESNFIIFFGSGANYAKLQPQTKDHVQGNYGLFWVFWTGKNVIYQGSMYVDIYRTKGIKAKQHLLREELTQSLGIMNDSYKYPDSIFQQNWTSTTRYSLIDRYIIKLLYDNRIKPGMTKKQVNNILRETDLIHIH